MKNNGIKSLNWPAYSPDLNPVENLWSLLKNNLSKYKILNLNLLESRIHNFFNNLPKKTIKNLTHSMRRRLEDLITHKGNVIKY